MTMYSKWRLLTKFVLYFRNQRRIRRVVNTHEGDHDRRLLQQVQARVHPLILTAADDITHHSDQH